MLKYKNQIINHLDQSKDLLEKLGKWAQYDRVTKEENAKILGDINRRLSHISDLIDIEQG